VTLLNRVGEQLTGWAASDVLGRPVTEIVELLAAITRLPVVNPISRAIAERLPTTLEAGTTLVRKNSTSVPIDDSAAPIIDERGRLLGGVMVFRDVTERCTHDEEIRRLNSELESRVVERTAQLESANKELDAFSYSVSHDLRAPLRHIDGFSRAVLDDQGDRLDANGRDNLRRVRAAAQRMAELIDDLLGLARVGRSELRRRNVDLSRIATEVGAGLAELHDERGVELVVMDGAMASCDPGLLEIVIENLIGNAWKFTSKQKLGRVEFGFRDEGSARTFFVRDNGAGFDTAYAAKLFGAFQRLHSANEFEGTGIGLATVQRIVHRHGGRVWAESEPGLGATFYFTVGAHHG
jgi:PAS domain S-box-containing protein